MRLLFKNVCYLALIFVPTLSYELEANGHRIVGDIASNHLSEQAKVRIADILTGEPLAFAMTRPNA